MHIFLSQGFRPFFLFAALWAALAMALWIVMWTGAFAPALSLSPLDWHTHELIFGYGGAVLSGFLLTAIPNWTKRPPVSGALLAVLFVLWVAARAAFLMPILPFPIASALQLSFPALFCLIAGRELILGSNRRNLPVLAICVAFLLANGWVLAEIHTSGSASGGAAVRAGLSLLLLLITLIGGRIIPAFTRNWLKARNAAADIPGVTGFDAAVMVGTAVGLTLWTAIPESPVTGGAALLLSVAHLFRLARWRGIRTTSEPLLFALHLAYAFLALGFLLTGLAALSANIVPAMAGLHAWSVGAVGLMTLTVMSRASLGHSGRPLTAGAIERAYLAALILAALTRIIGAWPEIPVGFLHASAGLWCLAYGLFAIRFTPVMVTPKVASKA